MEPVAITSLITMALGSVLKKSAEDYISDIIKGGLKDISKSDRKDVFSAVEAAFEEWLIAIIVGFQASGYNEEEIKIFLKDYSPAIDCFLADKAVIEELLKPFYSGNSSPSIDHNILMERWKILNLKNLPDEFNAAGATRLYSQKLVERRLLTPKLRGLLNIQILKEQVDLLKQLRPHWSEFNIDKYAKRIIAQYSQIDMSVLTPPIYNEENCSKLLQSIFVMPSIKKHTPPADLPADVLRVLEDSGNLVIDKELEKKLPKDYKGKLEEWGQQQDQDLFSSIAIYSSKGMVLVGDPGSGKSTISRYIILSILNSNSLTPKGLHSFSESFPLLVELRDYYLKTIDGKCNSIMEYLHYIGYSYGFHINADKLSELLTDNPSIIIFDGLDEIFDAKHRSDITNQIIGFKHDYPLVKLMVTSRIASYQGTLFRSAGFSEFTINDFSKDKVIEFLQNYYSDIFHDKRVEVSARVNNFLSVYEQSRAIKQIASNPLLLTILAIIGRHQEFPKERARLYSHVISVLSHDWDVTSKMIPKSHFPAEFMNLNDKMELLRRVAWNMQEGQSSIAGNYITEDFLRSLIMSYFNEVWNFTLSESSLITTNIIDNLRSRNFILCLWGSGIYGFVHRTFMEFLCAEGIRSRFEKEQIWSFNELFFWFKAKCLDSDWHEVLLWVCSNLSASVLEKLLKSLISEDCDVKKSLLYLTKALQYIAQTNNISRSELIICKILSKLNQCLVDLQHSDIKVEPIRYEELENSARAIFVSAKNNNIAVKERELFYETHLPLEKSDTPALIGALLAVYGNDIIKVLEKINIISNKEDSSLLDIVDDDIFVFTPKLDIVALPQGATCIDFAFILSPQIGCQTISQRINNRLSPLQTELHSGMQIDVITAHWARPNPLWLEYVCTNKAKDGIKKYLSSFSEKKLYSLGLRLFKKSLNETNLTEDSEEEIISYIAREKNYVSGKEFIKHIGKGNIIKKDYIEKIYDFFDKKV